MPAQLDPVDRFQPTAEEQERLALMSRPQAWFLENLRGPRELVGGQLLDPKLQYHLEDRRLHYDAVRRRRELFLRRGQLLAEI